MCVTVAVVDRCFTVTISLYWSQHKYTWSMSVIFVAVLVILNSLGCSQTICKAA